jgi:hypothetical protein
MTPEGLGIDQMNYPAHSGFFHHKRPLENHGRCQSVAHSAVPLMDFNSQKIIDDLCGIRGIFDHIRYDAEQFNSFRRNILSRIDRCLKPVVQPDASLFNPECAKAEQIILNGHPGAPGLNNIQMAAGAVTHADDRLPPRIKGNFSMGYDMLQL